LVQILGLMTLHTHPKKAQEVWVDLTEVSGEQSRAALPCPMPSRSGAARESWGGQALVEGGAGPVWVPCADGGLWEFPTSTEIGEQGFFGSMFR
jgi:hypothetical protein